jgi:hypothetical protein
MNEWGMEGMMMLIDPVLLMGSRTTGQEKSFLWNK